MLTTAPIATPLAYVIIKYIVCIAFFLVLTPKYNFNRNSVLANSQWITTQILAVIGIVYLYERITTWL
jgi:hypothetical protein